MPKSLLVVGSGAIGVEFALLLSQLRRRGDHGRSCCRRYLPVEDAEIAAFARKSFEKQGIKILDRRQSDQARQEGRQRHRDD